MLEIIEGLNNVGVDLVASDFTDSYLVYSGGVQIGGLVIKEGIIGFLELPTAKEEYQFKMDQVNRVVDRINGDCTQPAVIRF